MIDDLMARVAKVEKEKEELAGRYEKYATLSGEVANYKKRIHEMTSILEMKEKVIEKEKADKASIEHSQEDLLNKMKELQKENDNLVVRLEGLKTESEGLLVKNKKLEDRIKVLEDENKEQLKKINEALKMPVPISLNSDAVKERSQKELQKLEEFRERIAKDSTHHYLNLTSAKPILSVPSFSIADEKRPMTLQKDLKIIPTIVEPSSVEDSIREKENFSTLDSQATSTIPPDSPVPCTSKTFAETFSKSCKTYFLTSKSNLCQISIY